MTLLNAWNVCRSVPKPISACYLRILNWTNRDLPQVTCPYCKYHVLNFWNLQFKSSPSLFICNRKNLSTYDDISIVHIYYPLVESTLFSADVLMTWQEIVSKFTPCHLVVSNKRRKNSCCYLLLKIPGNFGGLLGLCLGFSLVNIVEIVYFATVRLYQNISLVYNNAKQNEGAIHQKPKLTREDKQIRNMYVNDFNRNDQKMFHYRS